MKIEKYKSNLRYRKTEVRTGAKNNGFKVLNVAVGT